MFASAFAATLRILFFRAGPQDFPHSSQLTPWAIGLALLANLSVFAQAMPLPLAAVMGGAMIAGMALATRIVLRARQMDARYNQTFNALLFTSACLTLLLAPPFAAVAPLLKEMAAKPELFEQPDQLKFPQGPVFLMNLLNFWNFAVTANIYRHATNTHLAVGVFIALVVALSVMFFVVLASSLIGGLLGLGAA